MAIILKDKDKCKYYEKTVHYKNVRQKISTEISF